MSTYEPQEGVFVGHPPCRHCGAALRLHRPTVAGLAVLPEDLAGTMPIAGRTYVTNRGLVKLAHAGLLACPEAYRPGSLEEAQRELAAAEASGDANRIFVARGEVQRLEARARD